MDRKDIEGIVVQALKASAAVRDVAVRHRVAVRRQEEGRADSPVLIAPWSHHRNDGWPDLPHHRDHRPGISIQQIGV